MQFPQAHFVRFFSSLFLLATLFAASPAQSTPDGLAAKLLLLSDNQEHLLTGGYLRSMSNTVDVVVTPVAVRSPLANIGGRALMGEILSFGQRESVDLVIHLGDASDISCPDEINSVFDALDKGAGDRWYLAPGNHDGIMAGTITKDQPPFDHDPVSIYSRPPAKAYKGINRTWLNACLSPSSVGDKVRGNVLTKGDAIGFYMDRLRARKGAIRHFLPSETVYVGGTAVNCSLEEIRNEKFNHTAVARICDRTRVKPNSQYWVGPYASYIVQKLSVGGVEMVLLDTSFYRNPRLLNVAMGGELSPDQTRTADRLIGNVQREKVIFGGHHPLGDIKTSDRKWIISRGGRYLSGHVHRSTQFIEHKADGRTTSELNIGSTLDYPSQTAIARLDRGSLSYKVAGAPASETGWSSYLQPCLDNELEWKLLETVYKNYRYGPYIARVIDALNSAAKVYNAKISDGSQAFNIPDGSDPNDWAKIEQILREIGHAEGRTRTFWACQAYYAAKATRDEKSQPEAIARKFGFGSKQGKSALGVDGSGEWFVLPVN